MTSQSWQILNENLLNCLRFQQVKNKAVLPEHTDEKNKIDYRIETRCLIINF